MKESHAAQKKMKQSDFAMTMNVSPTQPAAKKQCRHHPLENNAVGVMMETAQESSITTPSLDQEALDNNLIRRKLEETDEALAVRQLCSLLDKAEDKLMEKALRMRQSADTERGAILAKFSSKRGLAMNDRDKK